MVTEDFQFISGRNGEITRKEMGGRVRGSLGNRDVPSCLCI